MELIFVRHGETDSNKQRVIQGARLDPSLNTEGISQANELAETLKDVKFDIIISSPLKRALETAEIIKKHFNVPLEIAQHFLERDFGSLTGKNWEEIGEITGLGKEKVMEIDMAQQYDYRPYGGQSAEEVRKGLIDGIEHLKTKYPDKKLLVVTHGGVIRLMHLLYTEEPEEKHLRPGNASVHYFEI